MDTLTRTQAEKHTQGMTYFKALYLCYVSLLTVGYGKVIPNVKHRGL